MAKDSLKRRDFLKLSALMSLGVAAPTAMELLAYRQAHAQTKLKASFSSAGLAGTWNAAGEQAARYFAGLLGVEIHQRIHATSRRDLHAVVVLQPADRQRREGREPTVEDHVSIDLVGLVVTGSLVTRSARRQGLEVALEEVPLVLATGLDRK